MLPKISATFGKGSFFFSPFATNRLPKSIQYIEEKEIYLYVPNTLEAKWATLESMGLRSVKAVAKHILQENVWESNLIPDIAGVDYFAGHQERTNLQPLVGLPVFVDDFYAYGPLRENEIVRVRGRKPACTTGEEDSGKRVVSQISLFVRQVWGCEDGHKNVSIAHTVYANSRSSRIIDTVEKIEKETGYRARKRWKERLFCCQGRCLRVANEKASERPSSNAAPADVGWLCPIPNRLHTRLLGNFGETGIGAASRERTRLFPTRPIRLSREWQMHFGQYRQRWRPCVLPSVQVSKCPSKGWRLVRPALPSKVVDTRYVWDQIAFPNILLQDVFGNCFHAS